MHGRQLTVAGGFEIETRMGDWLRREMRGMRFKSKYKLFEQENHHVLSTS